MKIQNNKKKLTTILPAIVVGVIMATMFANSPILMKADAIATSTGHPRPLAPLSFSTTINGHENAEIVATVNRGETSQLDVLATPLINGISGNMEVYSSLPQCGTINVSVGCTPSGISVSLPSSSRVSSIAHMPLTISVSKDMPPGTYWYSLATIPINDPSQNLPTSLWLR